MGASTQAKSFMQMEKELRAKIDGMSDDEKSKAFFKAMVAQDADQIRRLLAALVDHGGRFRPGVRLHLSRASAAHHARRGALPSRV